MFSGPGDELPLGKEQAVFKLTQTALVTLALLSFGLGACFLNKPKEPSLGELLQKRAAYDMRCPASRLRYHELSKKTYGVSGCGRRATYMLICRYIQHHAYSSERECRWVMNNALSR